MRDPRSHRRYVQARRLWLDGYGGGLGRCVLCGKPVNTSLPGTHPLGPTIEHTFPVRNMKRRAQDFAELLALACDTSLWRLAHRRCQSQQGARAKNAMKIPRRNTATTGRSSRNW